MAKPWYNQSKNWVKIGNQFVNNWYRYAFWGFEDRLKGRVQEIFLHNQAVDLEQEDYCKPLLDANFLVPIKGTSLAFPNWKIFS